MHDVTDCAGIEEVYGACSKAVKMSSCTHILLIVVAALTMSACDAITADVLRTLKSTIASHSHAVNSRRPRVISATARRLNQQLVDVHNTLRAREGAANMELISYDDALARLADQKASSCSDVFDSAGVATYKIYNDTLMDNLAIVVKDIYQLEKSYYLQKMCSSVSSCRHYVQLVLAKTTHIGCAYAVCVHSDHYHYLLCLYRPWVAGKEKLHEKGPACSRCPSGMGWCTKKLCNNKCANVSEECPWTSCAAVCHNCATLDDKQCRCDCAEGWSGTDCSECREDRMECADISATGDIATACREPSTRLRCPETCWVCTTNPEAKAKCPPTYGPAASGPPGTGTPGRSGTGIPMTFTMSLIKVHHVTLTSVMVLVALIINNGLNAVLH